MENLTTNLTANQDLMKEARSRLSGGWGYCVGFIFVYFLVILIFDGLHTFIFKGNYFGVGQAGLTNLISNTDRIKFKDYGLDKIANLILAFVVHIPLYLGVVIFFLNLTRKSEVSLKQLLGGYRHFLKSVEVSLLLSVYIFLWTLILIIPGVMAYFNYVLSYFILIDNPDMNANQIITESKRLMNGNKWKFFCLGLRFLGWSLLGTITLGIGFLWVIPYIQTSFSLFYEDVKRQGFLEKTEESGVISQ